MCASRTRPLWRGHASIATSRPLSADKHRLVDEARLRLPFRLVPCTEIDQLEREKISLEIEREALKRETDPNSIERRNVVERDTATLTEKITASALAGQRARSHQPHQ